MADRKPHEDADRKSVSLPGLFCFLCGSGALFAYWKFSRLTTQWIEVDRLLFVAVAACLAMWGLIQLLNSWWPRGGSRWDNRSSQSRAGRRREPKRASAIPWGGILLVVAGVGFLIALRWRDLTGSPASVVVLLGLGCIFLGVLRIITTLLRGKRGNRPRDRRALSKPGLMFLVIMTVLLGGSLIGQSNMLMLVFALMVGPFVLNGWVTFSMLRRTGVTRFVPERARAGEPFSVGVCLENRKFLLASTVMTVTDEIESDAENLEARVLFSRVPARRSMTRSYRVRLMQRGLYQFGPIHLTTRFPLGLVERGLTFALYDKVLVYPRIGDLTEAWQRDHAHAAEIVDTPAPTRGTFHDEFQGLREYRPGDSPRAIHWRTSARLGELMVREFHQNRGQDLMLLLDLWIPEQANAEDLERVELAVSFAATLAVEQMRKTRDARLEVALCGRQMSRWEGRTGSAGIDSLLERLALVEPSPTPDIQRLFEESVPRRTSHMRVLLLTTRPDQAELLKTAGETSLAGGSFSLGRDVEILTTGREELAPFFVLE